ncbi:MAG: saccharopine dehydrogenase NADP-binding domain-containing protein [Anaerolineales bacterium]|nr:saccharopine dehydrogenase NADP-binding domain-containing protein [Anaerolineales bacterium]
MSYRYAVIGAGRQGTAAAFDLGKFGSAEFLLMADTDRAQAEGSAVRINELLNAEIAQPLILDASDTEAVITALKTHKIDAFIGATPYYLNLSLTRAAIEASSGMTDLGGNSDVVQKQLLLSSEAEKAKITIVPDCGLGPGMTTTLALYAMEQLDEPEDVYIWDCGLPQDPQPPWNYKLTFSIGGLTNEYSGDCLFIREGKTVRIPALDELEILEFPEPIGELEAFTTSGGVTTAAQTFAGKLRTLQNKTMRYPGHLRQLKVIQELGFLDEEPIDVGGASINPRQVLHTLWEPQIRAEADMRDLAIIRVLAKGKKDGKDADAQVEIFLYYDEATGFTAMEQGTGWHASILTIAIASGRITHGVIPLEKAMSGNDFVGEAAKRGFNIKLDP